jgi:hypothetical protein
MSAGMRLFGCSGYLSIFCVLGFSCLFILSSGQACHAGFIQKIRRKKKRRRFGNTKAREGQVLPRAPRGKTQYLTPKLFTACNSRWLYLSEASAAHVTGWKVQ